MRLLKGFAKFSFALVGLVYVGLAGAVDGSFKAFGTLGAVGSDSDRVGFRRDLTQNHGVTRSWDANIDSRLGLQVDVELNEEFHAGAQWVARNHVGNFFEQNLDWAYLRWRPRPDTDLRIGRLGVDDFLLSDYRNVGYAYPWMRPPTEFYGPLYRYHFDGFDLARRFPIGDGYLRLKTFAGYSINDFLPQQQGAAVQRVESVIFGGTLLFETDEWRFHLAYTQNRPQDNLSPGPLANPQVVAGWPGVLSLIDAMSLKDKILHFGSIGVAYDDGVWPIQAEAAYIASNIEWIPDFTSAYLSVGRRFGPVTFYTLYGVAQSFNNHPRPIPQPLVSQPALLRLASGAESFLTGNAQHDQSLSLGTRWDVYKNVAIKAQWSHYWLGGTSQLVWQTVEPPQPGGVNVWSFGVDFVY